MIIANWTNDNDDSRATIHSGGNIVNQAEWSPNGKMVAVVITYRENDENFRKATIWEYKDNEFTKIFSTNKSIGIAGPISWSSDGTMIAIGCFKGMFDPSIRILNTTSWETIQVLRGDFLSVENLDWSWDDNYLAVSDINIFGGDSRIVIYTTSNWSNFTIPSLSGIRTLKWSPVSYQLASGHLDHTIRIHNPTGVILTVLIGHNRTVECLDWSLDSNSLASGSSEKIIVWYTHNWTVNQEIENPSDDEDYRRIIDVEWIGDDSIIAFCDVYQLGIYLWSVEEIKIIGTICGHENSLTSLSWNENHNLIASASNDGTVKIWSVT